jgi:hypothetical protein
MKGGGKGILPVASISPSFAMTRRRYVRRPACQPSQRVDLDLYCHPVLPNTICHLA